MHLIFNIGLLQQCLLLLLVRRCVFGRGALVTLESLASWPDLFFAGALSSSGWFILVSVLVADSSIKFMIGVSVFCDVFATTMVQISDWWRQP